MSSPTTMIAYRYVPGTLDVVSQHIPIPVAQEGEVLLRVEVAGLCHSDLHVLSGFYRGVGPLGDATYTLGHEVCAIAVSAHTSVTTIVLGARYVVAGPNPCGACPACLANRDNICSGGVDKIGLGTDGGFAEYLTVAAKNVVRVPDGVTPSQAAACTDALVTPYHGVKTVAKLQAHENVVVIGLGGVGMNALKIAKLFGNKVYASDIKPEVMEAALAAGATAALPAAELEALLTGPSAPPIALTIDCVGIPSTFSLAQRLAATGGRVLLLGLMSATLDWEVKKNVDRELNLLMSLWGTKAELGEVMELVREGKLSPDVEVRKMNRLGEAIEEMKGGKIKGRLAFVPETC